MSFLVNWWVGYRRRQHRREALPFVLAGLACSVILFVGAYALMRRAAPAAAPAGEPAKTEAIAGAPDFVALMPSAEGEPGRSIVRLPNDQTEGYVVGYRSERGPALGLVVKGLVGYRVVATLELTVGRATPTGHPAVYLWPSQSGAQRVIALMPQEHGGSAAYVVTADDGRLALVERATPMSDVPPQYVALGETDGPRRTARFGDLDGDGRANELVTEIRQGSEPARYEVYELKDGRLAWRGDLIAALSRSAALFDDNRADVTEMLVIDAATRDAEPTVVEFPPSL